MLLRNFHKRLSNIYPRKIRDEYEIVLKYAAIKKDTDEYIGQIISITLVLAVIIAVLSKLINKNPYLIFFASLIGLHIIAYFLVYFKAEKRSQLIEKAFPFALKTIATNLRSGMQIDKAIYASISDDLGPLKDEFKDVYREILIGKNSHTALENLSLRIKSKKVSRTIKLMVYSIKTGGALADLIDEASEDLTSISSMDERNRSAINGHETNIIMMITTLIPIFCSLTKILVGIIQGMMKEINVPEQAGYIGVKINNHNMISPVFIENYTFVLIVITVFLGSLTLGVINTGKVRYGLKRFPLYLIIALSIYILTSSVLLNIFGGVLRWQLKKYPQA